MYDFLFVDCKYLVFLYLEFYCDNFGVGFFFRDLGLVGLGWGWFWFRYF